MPKIILNSLTDLTVKQAKPKAREYSLVDGSGLFLVVTPGGGKLWRLRARLGDRRINQTLGRYPTISLAEARLRRDEAMRLRERGINPREAKEQEALKAALAEQTTFAYVAEQWLQTRQRTLAAVTYKRLDERTRTHLLPALGSYPVTDIKAPLVLSVLKVFDDSGRGDMARRLLGIVNGIMTYAVIHGLADANPCQGLIKGLSERARVQHRRGIIREDELAQALRLIWGYTGNSWIQVLIKLQVLLAQRPGETRCMEWRELDLNRAEWVLPAAKTKMRKEHLVPLPQQAVALLRGIQPLTGHGQYVFPNMKHLDGTQPVSDGALLGAYRSLGIDTTAHGFRATFRTLGCEVLGENPLVLEAQLAHRVPDALGTAYNRASYLPQRRAFMQRWADYLDGLRQRSEQP